MPAGELAEQGAGDLLVDQIVLDQQYPQAVAQLRVRFAGRAGRRTAAVDDEGQFDAEGAAFSRRRFDGDAAAHQFDQALADRQAEAGAAKLAGGRGVTLEEGREQAGDHGRRHADAGVADRNLQALFVVVQGPAGEMDADAADRGEFDGIADQVDQDLAQAAGVADQACGNGRVDVAGECDFLGDGRVAEQCQGVVQDFGRGEGNVFDFQLAGFDLGKVEHVVDQPEQAVGAVADGFRVIALLGVQRRGQQEVGHADHAVHRGADFVAHVGQEVALGDAGGFRRGAGIVELFVGAHALDQAAGPTGQQLDEFEVRRVEVVVAMLARREIDRPVQCAVDPDRRAQEAGQLELAETRMIAVVGFGDVDQLEQFVLADDFGAEGVAEREFLIVGEQAVRTDLDFDPVAVGRRVDVADDGVFEVQVLAGQTQPLAQDFPRVETLDRGDFVERLQGGQLALEAQCLQALFGDVLENAQVIDQLSVAVADDGNGQPFLDQAAVLALVDDFAAPDVAFVDGLPHLPVEPGIVPAGAEDTRGLADQFAGTEAGNLLQLRVDGEDAALGVGHQDAAGAVLEYLGRQLPFVMQAGLVDQAAADAADQQQAQGDDDQQRDAGDPQGDLRFGVPLLQRMFAVHMHEHEQGVVARSAVGAEHLPVAVDVFGAAADFAVVHLGQRRTAQV